MMHLRWLILRDMKQVLRIDELGFVEPWGEEALRRQLRQRNCIGMVVEVAERIAGFMVYDLHSTRFNLLRLAFAPEFRRRGVGRAMLEKFHCKLRTGRRTSVVAKVPERDLEAQLFFRACGWRATCVDHDSETIRFMLRVREAVEKSK